MSIAGPFPLRGSFSLLPTNSSFGWYVHLQFLNNSYVTNIIRSTNKRNNLNHRQRQVLNQLIKRTDIINKKAANGDTIVVETTENYVKDGMAHFSNFKYYLRLESDSYPTIAQSITKFLNNAYQHGLIDTETFNFLLSPSPSRSPIVYFATKLHKTPISITPIISHVNSPTRNISAFIDQLLKPIVKSILHILKNTQTIITELQSITYQHRAI